MARWLLTHRLRDMFCLLTHIFRTSNICFLQSGRLHQHHCQCNDAGHILCWRFDKYDYGVMSVTLPSWCMFALAVTSCFQLWCPSVVCRHTSLGFTSFLDHLLKPVTYFPFSGETTTSMLSCSMMMLYPGNQETGWRLWHPSKGAQLHTLLPLSFTLSFRLCLSNQVAIWIVNSITMMPSISWAKFIL